MRAVVMACITACSFPQKHLIGDDDANGTSGFSPTHEVYVQADPVQANAYFGQVALSHDGSVLAVGASSRGGGSGAIVGAVYVFSVANNAVNQTAMLMQKTPNISDEFGASVALSADGSFLAVGAPNGGPAQQGEVYLFHHTGSSWTEDPQSPLVCPHAGTDLFGAKLALSADGATLAIGAPGQTGSATQQGAVYVFTHGITWSLAAHVLVQSPTAGDLFGYALALSGDGGTLAVGAALHNFMTGAAYVFTRSQGWMDEVDIVPLVPPIMPDLFGGSVSLSNDGTTLVVTSPQEASAAKGVVDDTGDTSAANAGAAFVFVHSGSMWTQQAYVKASNTDSGDKFGTCTGLASDGNTLVIGALWEASSQTGIDPVNQSDNSVAQAGAAYVYARSGTVWAQTHYLKAATTGVMDLFGSSCAISGTGAVIAVGAVLDDSTNDSTMDAGAAYVFQ
jgi:hypothetical protein